MPRRGASSRVSPTTNRTSSNSIQKSGRTLMQPASDGQQGYLLFSGRTSEGASLATSAPARAYNVVRVGRRRILLSVFFEKAPTTEREETNLVFHFVTTC